MRATTICRTEGHTEPAMPDSDMCRECVAFTWKHGRRPDDVSPFLRRVRDREVPTMVVGGVAA